MVAISAGMGLFLLWVLSRSNLSSGRTIQATVSNPVDLTAGTNTIDPNTGQIIPGVYGTMRVAFPLPSARRLSSQGTSIDGKRRYEVWEIGSSPTSVSITIPNGIPGAGTNMIIGNWVSPNLGEGIYTVYRDNTDTHAPTQFFADGTTNNNARRPFGIYRMRYETAQRYVLFNDKEIAAAASQSNLDAYNTPSSPPDPDSPPPDTDDGVPPIPPTIDPDAPPPPTLGGQGGMVAANAPTSDDTLSETQKTYETLRLEKMRAVNDTLNTSLQGDSFSSLNG